MDSTDLPETEKTENRKVGCSKSLVDYTHHLRALRSSIAAEEEEDLFFLIFPLCGRQGLEDGSSFPDGPENTQNDELVG